MGVRKEEEDGSKEGRGGWESGRKRRMGVRKEENGGSKEGRGGLE
jgi:hypothetical protein